MRHFKLRKDLSRELNGRILYRIEATKGNPRVKEGTLGGFVESENNLSDNAWVDGNACIYGNARVHEIAYVSGDAYIYGNADVRGNACVYGNARVYGYARVSGDAHVSTLKECINITNLRNEITITKNHIQIGCEFHTIAHWKKEIKNIGKKHGYTDKEIKATILMLKGALALRGDLK